MKRSKKQTPNMSQQRKPTNMSQHLKYHLKKGKRNTTNMSPKSGRKEK